MVSSITVLIYLKTYSYSIFLPNFGKNPTLKIIKKFHNLNKINELTFSHLIDNFEINLLLFSNMVSKN